MSVESVLDRESPQSAISLLPTVVGDACESAVMALMDLSKLHERQLLAALRKLGKSPTPNDNRLRLSFWDEYDRAVETGSKMRVGHIVHGVCQQDYFYNEFLKKPHKVIWMITPPASFETLKEEALCLGIGQIRDILETPHVVDGVIDEKLVALKARLVKTLEGRKRTPKQMELDEQEEPTQEDLSRRLESLRKREAESRNAFLTETNDEEDND
jgi:hypothetical protein